MVRLGDVMDDVRWQGFVGRGEQVVAFDEALAGRSPHRVLFVHGAGGVGKTTLLLHLRSRAQRAGRTAVYLDGSEMDPSPEGFVQAVGAHTAPVLLVDGYEHLTPIDGWLRRDLVPTLPADGVVVIAGRNPPGAAWRSDLGWRGLVAVHMLVNLDDADSAALLERAGVAAPDREPIMRLGRGHPLALALLADATANNGAVPRTLAEAPDLISALIASLVQEAPSDAHLAGLGTCAKVLLTTEDLLRRTVGDDAPRVWEWLRDRPFITVRPHGLTPHDLTRTVLDAEFERRFPDRYRELHRVIHDYVVTGLHNSAGTHRQLLAQQLAQLHRQGPFSTQFRAVAADGNTAVVPARPEELADAVELIGRHVGARSAELARGWFAERPAGGSVVRAEGGIGGFCYHVLGPAGSTMENQDPIVREIHAHIARTAPLRPGEQVDISRFLLGRDGAQSDPYAVFTGSISSIVEWCGRPLAWAFIVSVEPEFWGPFFDYLAFREVLEVTFDGRRHVVYGNDWRRFPVGAWLELMYEREQSGGTGPPPDSMQLPAPLGRAAFDTAVRAALPNLCRPDRLAGSRLVGTRLGADPAAVRTALRTAVGELAGLPRGDRLRAVLHRTYLSPAPTQEAAAEVLGLPFSTYRRHLAKAVDELVERLWARETGQELGGD
ncbi:ATP-binding protein [Actinoplanes sp. NPDC051861]|uniref:ATP-binding protein n=1 Tax=Actinoplanes sp. NPDC051861 TaxID=3155170 RepID=UPI003442704E